MFDRIGRLLRPRPPAAAATSIWQRDTARFPPFRGTFHYLLTGRGNLLCTGGHFVEMQDESTKATALVGMVPDDNRQVMFLLAPNLERIELRDDGLRAAALSAGVVQGETQGSIRLRHPLAPVRFLGVTAAGVGGPGGCVVFNTLGETELDRFTCVPVLATALSPQLELAAAELAAASVRPMRAELVVSHLERGLLRPSLAETVLRVLPWDELAVLARMFMAQKGARNGALDVVSGCLGENRWFAQVLPALVAWQGARPAVPGHHLESPVSDEFAGDPLEGFGHVQVGFALNALARADMRPRRQACLVASVQNEGAYLVDWLAYHFSVGFEHAFIYANDTATVSDALLRALAGSRMVTVVHNRVGRHFGAHHKAYAHALTLLPQVLDYRWCAILGIDEYFAFDSRMFRGVQDYLAWQETQPVDAVALCRQVFCANRQDVWRDAFTPARFCKREPRTNPLVKSIFKPRAFWNAHPHFPHSTMNAPFVYRTEAGALHHHAGVRDRPAAHAANPSAALAWINHYRLRSAPEALWKQAGVHETVPADLALSISRDFLALADTTDLVDDRRILACAGGLEPWLARLRAAPGVAVAEARAKAGHGASLCKVARDFMQVPPGDGPAEVAAFRAVLAGLPLDQVA
jgi:hypothetical protein